MPNQFIARLILVFIGLLLLAFGVAIAIRSNLGTSPISSLPYVYSFIVPLSVGVMTILMHIVMIILQMLLLKTDFQMRRWLQLPVGILFGFFIDLMLWLSQAWSVDTYIMQIVMCLISCLITSIGVCCLIKANLVLLAGEGLYQAVSIRFGWSFASCKLYGDICLVSLAIISSIVFLSEIVGVREGTILTALLVGPLVKYLMPRFSFK